jgi:putative radical SAM enzyme (TIGR03279 family)
VHATNPELRVQLVGNPKAAKIMDDLARLDRLGIDFHCQLVLVPGVNDGPELDRSLRDLSQFGERLKSIAGVPVGLTKYGLERQSKQLRNSRTCMRTLPGKQITVRRYTPDEARAVVAHAEQWQARFREERGKTFFLLGDEFYLMAGLPVPPADIYDGFPQIEDGIGITRDFLDKLDRYLRRTRSDGLRGAGGTIACGELIAPTMQESVARLNEKTGSELELRVIENHYLGREITVSGLLTGSDVARTLGSTAADGPVYISNRMISDRTGTLLDDMTIEQLSEAVQRPVVAAPDLAAVAKDLLHRKRRLPATAA